MMRQALRDIGIPEHVALAYNAWAPMGEDGQVPDDRRASWLADLANISVAPHYARSFERWRASFTATGDRVAEFTLESRLLIGHGNASATDVGLTVHHTWGVPVIPGSALKGLLAHYVDATYGPADVTRTPREQEGEERIRSDFQGVTWRNSRIQRGPGKVYRALFGAPDALEDAMMRENNFEAGAAAGLVTFHDALYVPGSLDNKPFAVDVLTVHQKSYYDSLGQSAPNDYDSPNPVAFLTVRPKCRFLLALSGPSEWTDLAGKLLADALASWGVGGKTSAGYGIGKVSEWKAPGPRRSRVEQMVAELEKYGKDALVGGIEQWLRGEAVTGPMRALLSASLDAASKEHLEVVRALGAKFDLRAAWTKRLTNKKADEQRKARARALIKAWDDLFPEGDKP
jgi:CRISPR type III-B/RAMP module RAMP protein Cmr6